MFPNFEEFLCDSLVIIIFYPNSVCDHQKAASIDADLNVAVEDNV